eukprot:5616879-Amphidinium_carterae.1
MPARDRRPWYLRMFESRDFADIEEHSPTVLADEGDEVEDGVQPYRDTVLLPRRTASQPTDSTPSVASDSVSEQQRLEVERLLVDAQAASASKAPRIWWEKGFSWESLWQFCEKPLKAFPAPLCDDSLAAS